jgi:hypothetical protein
MGGIVGDIFGAPQAASNAEGYYQNAANDVQGLYSGPGAQDYVEMQNRALQPQFRTQDQDLTDFQAAQGTTGSGASRADFSTLGAAQSAALAGADAPLYAQGMAEQAGIYGQMPGAQENAYQTAVAQGYQALDEAGEAAAGVPPTGGGSSDGTTGIWDPYGGGGEEDPYSSAGSSQSGNQSPAA